jgi:hypothetical protein
LPQPKATKKEFLKLKRSAEKLKVFSIPLHRLGSLNVSFSAIYVNVFVAIHAGFPFRHG